MLPRTAKSCGPDAPTLASSFAGSFPVQATVAKEPGHRGEHEVTVKTIAQGRPDVFGEPVVTVLVCFFISHARLRVHRAPGFPCALCFESDHFSGTTRARGVAGKWTCAS